MWGHRQHGFTIVETMIVLGVSAALVSTAMLYVGGRQNRTQFTVAINDEKQFIEETINETANGYYPHATTFDCAGSTGARPAFSNIGTSTKQQGANSGCTFLGKVMVFGADSFSNVAIYPIVGNQKTAGANARDVQSFAEALPVVLGPPGTATLPNFSTTRVLENGLSLVSATYAGSYTNHLGILVFADDLSQYSTSAGNLNTAADRLDLFTYPQATVLSLGTSATTPAISTALVNDPVNGMNVSAPQTPGVSKIDLCFASGGTNQSGKITISGAGQLSVSLTIWSTKTCT